MKLTIITQDSFRETVIQSSSADVSLFPLANVTGAIASRETSIPFSYGVVIPYPLWSGSGYLRACSLVIIEPFPPGTTLEVGTAVNPSVIISSSESLPSEIGEYAVSRWLLLEDNPVIQLTLSLPPGTDQGRGYLQLSL